MSDKASKYKRNKTRIINNLRGRRQPPNRKFTKRTGIEKEMMKILKDLHLEYEIEYPIWFADSWKLYDFRINPNILIEVDGDYFHGNPSKNIDKRKNFFILKNKKNDVLKNFVAKRNGYRLLRFWEDQIYNNKDEVINELLDNLNKSLLEEEDKR